ncbi:hypothetical protein TorRG33x02_092670, partial [Trema orientale]
WGDFKYEGFFLASLAPDIECLGTTLLVILILVAIFDTARVTHSITDVVWLSPKGLSVNIPDSRVGSSYGNAQGEKLL